MVQATRASRGAHRGAVGARRRRPAGSGAPRRRAAPTAGATHGQIRSVTSAVSCGEGSGARGNVSGGPARTPTRCGRIRQPRRTASVPTIADGDHRRAGLEREPPDPAPRAAERARAACACPRGTSARSRRARGSPARSRTSRVARPAVDREGAERAEQPATRRAGARTAPSWRRSGSGAGSPSPITNGSRNERWLAARITGPVGGDVLAPETPHAEVDVGRPAARTTARQPVDERIRRPRAGGSWWDGRAGRKLPWRADRRPDPAYPGAGAPVTVPRDGVRSGHGPCAAPSPAPSRRACGRRSSRSTSACSASAYDDAELLGRSVTRGPAADAARPPRSTSANGALFGALYANVAPSLPVPACGPRPAGGARRASRHLARDRLLGRPSGRPATCPRCGAARPRVRPGDVAPPALRRRARRARAPAELADAAPRGPLDDVAVSSNGHGAVEHLVAPPGPDRDDAHHRRVGLRRRATSRARAPRRGTTWSTSRARAACASTCSTAAAVGGGRARRRPGPSSTTSPRAPTSGARGGSRRVTLADNQAMTRQPARGRPRGGAGRGRRLRLQRRGLRPAGRAAGRRGRARCARRTPTRSPRRAGDLLAGFYADALRAARGARPRVQPRRPRPGAELRDRLLRPPGRRRARGRRGPRPRRDRQPGRPPRLHRRARRRARPTARWPARRAGRLQRLLRPARLGRRGRARARRGLRRRDRHGGRPARSCARTR